MEYSALDIVLAVTTASVVMVGSVVVLRATSSGALASAPEIDIGVASPVRVVPIVDLDSPLLKLGGRRTAASLPDRWVKKARPASEPTVASPTPDRKARPSPQAKADEKDIPPPDVELSDAGAPPPDAAPDAPETDAAVSADTDASAPAETDTDAGPATPGEGQGGAGPASSVAGPGHPDGVPDGTETDPLKARALDVYRARLIAFFSSRFRVTGSGLPQSTLTSLRVGATVQISGGRAVSYTLSSSGNASFDGAARVALESAKGQSVPPPPENYPDLVQAQISLTFVCKEGKCD
ncbi:MAG: energy transducer TonB [Polyangiaceae bacterium]